MNLDGDRAAIVALVSSVTDVGKVYDHYKYSSDWGTFLDQFAYVPNGGRKQIRGWWLSIPAVRRGQGGLSTYGEDELTDLLDWPLRAVMSFSDKDGSEAAFETLIYTVRDTLRSSLTFGLGASIIVPGTVSVTIPTVDIRQYGSTLCHYAELHIEVERCVPALTYTT